MLATKFISVFYSLQSTASINSISKSEMNLEIPLCNDRHLNDNLKISLEIFLKKDTITGKNYSKLTWERTVIFEILNTVM